jgi:thiamine-phosphate pyrophosphorylase
MSARPLLCYITDRTQFANDEEARRTRLLEKIAEAARCGVDFVQLREKDLCSRELEGLAIEALRVIRSQPETSNETTQTRLLINSRTDVALAVGAAGVHLPVNDISPGCVREIWATCSQGLCGAGTPARAVVSISCHSEQEVAEASQDADLALFAPVFEKPGALKLEPAGVERLRKACQHKIPVLALGGVTLGNAHSCLEVGAAGIAGIRLFQENEIEAVVQAVRYA